ncbi:hypothetical protein BROUX41_003500 [Berkeleyomyces rouxiae]
MANHNPGNYHFIESDVNKATCEWLEEYLPTMTATEGEVSARITNVIDTTGDFTVYNRKGDVKAFFEMDLTVEYSGSAPKAEDVTGTITAKDVNNQIAEDKFKKPKTDEEKKANIEAKFAIAVHNESKDKQPVKDLVRSQLIPQLVELVWNLPQTLIERHRGVVQHAAGADPSRGFTPAKVYVNPIATKPSTSSAAANPEPTKKNSPVNTTTVTDTEEFRTTAEELYKTFTDVARISAFTRGHPKVFEGAKQGGKFEIFDGNVSGQYLELEEPKRIVQTWRLKQWPADHFSRLEISFDQNNVDHVTVMNVKWTGVPTGEEDVTKRNWRDYYVRSIKQTFGFGTIL